MDECPICFEIMLPDSKDTILLECCKKKFHKECYLKCMKLKRECPMCRNTSYQLNIDEVPEHQIIVISSNRNNNTKCRYLLVSVITLCFGCFTYFIFFSRR